jgi:signal peptidase I
MFNTDSWVWKIAIVIAILAVREFVRAVGGGTTQRTLAHAARQPGGGMSVRSSGADDTNENVKWIIETLDSAALAIGLVLFVIQPFLLQAFYIPSGSMEDTLRYQPTGDRLLVSKFVYRMRDPRASDVVVFKPPPQADAKPGDDFIKRCIGAPGDIVEARGRSYFRNGKSIKEPYVKWSSQTYSYDMKIVDGKLYTRESNPAYGFNSTAQWVQEGHGAIGAREPAPDQAYITNHKPEPIPAGMYLMLGDHRDNSNDSHAWGLVPRKNIIGKAFFVFWPPRRLGLIDNMSEHPRAPTAIALPRVLPPQMAQ